MEVVIYLLLGLGAMGGLFWLLTQVTARQQRLNAELTRLERLAADVAMSAEAVLEQVDERTEQLQKLVTEIEERLTSAAAVQRAERQSEVVQAAAVQTAAPETTQTQSPAIETTVTQSVAGPGSEPEQRLQQPAPRKRGRPRKVQPATPAPAPAILGRYQAIRAEVLRLAEQGQGAAAISQQLDVPRGEVQLILNLMFKKSGAQNA